MEPITKTCPTCSSLFIITNPRSRQVFCGHACRPERKPVQRAERVCATCTTPFTPAYECQKYCGDNCKWKGFSKNRQVKHEPRTCDHCKKTYEPKRKRSSKHCSAKCYYTSKHNDDVELTCTVCAKSFTVLYKFRGTKTCSPECTGAAISRANNTRVTKHCLACGEAFDVVQSYKDAAKYCTYACFLSTRDTKQPDVQKVCEYCNDEFTVPYTHRDQRFCGYSCANSGENNAFYGLTGSLHPMFGKSAWNRGQTAETNPILKAAGEKISAIVADKMVSGSWSPGCNGGFVTEWYTGVKNGGIPVFLRSSYESIFIRMMDASDDVVQWEHEPLRLQYVFEDRVHNYVPDVLVTMIDDTKCLVEIKPIKLTIEPKNVAKRRVAEEWCAANDVTFTLVTECDLGLDERGRLK